MTTLEIIELIKQHLIEIIPELEDTDIDVNESFIDLGANSIDRGELITMTLEVLELEVSRINFVNAQSIHELAEIIEGFQK